MRKISSLAFAITTAAILSACSTPVKVAEPAPVVEKPVTPPPMVDNTRTVAPVVAAAIDPLNDPQGVLAKRSVYFDFNSYVVRDDGKAVVQNHSDYLQKKPNRSILIQGNTDRKS